MITKEIAQRQIVNDELQPPLRVALLCLSICCGLACVSEIELTACILNRAWSVLGLNVWEGRGHE